MTAHAIVSPGPLFIASEIKSVRVGASLSSDVRGVVGYGEGNGKK